ncbi:AAA family ATPase [Leifsonia sp. NPDC058292]|uniref:phosphotransferase-like protein n=1 Tax=Leifsonia sp. NPDC058292 TaxID=3346428 RepID=UPI0036D8694E
MPVIAVFLNGTVGVGKSTVARAIGDLLAAERVPNAVIDLDDLRRAWPAPSDDPFNSRLELLNLRPMAANYIAAGARVLVLAGVIETLDAVADYRSALGDAVLTVVRLTVDTEEAERRLIRRHDDDAAGLAWHRARFGELDAVIDAARIPGPTLDTTNTPPAALARLILSKAIEYGKSAL